jgi:hypothetical protein
MDEHVDVITWAEAITDHERRRVRLEEVEHQIRALTAWCRYLEARLEIPSWQSSRDSPDAG